MKQQLLNGVNTHTTKWLFLLCLVMIVTLSPQAVAQPNGLDINKTVSPITAPTGGTFNFRIRASNTSNTNAINAIVSDQIPDGIAVDFSTLTYPIGTTHTYNSSTRILRCTIPTLLAHSTVEIRFSALAVFAGNNCNTPQTNKINFVTLRATGFTQKIDNASFIIQHNLSPTPSPTMRIKSLKKLFKTKKDKSNIK